MTIVFVCIALALILWAGMTYLDAQRKIAAARKRKTVGDALNAKFSRTPVATDKLQAVGPTTRSYTPQPRNHSIVVTDHPAMPYVHGPSSSNSRASTSDSSSSTLDYLLAAQLLSDSSESHSHTPTEDSSSLSFGGGESGGGGASGSWSDNSRSSDYSSDSSSYDSSSDSSSDCSSSSD